MNNVVPSLLYRSPFAELKLVCPLPTDIDVSEEHPVKAVPATEVTLFGIVIPVRAVQSPNAFVSIAVTPSDMMIFVRELHL